MAPAPRPKGMARKKSQMIDGEKEYPIKATAVNNTLTSVIRLVLNLWINRALFKELIIVQPEINIDKTPAIEIGAFKSRRIAGQVEPSNESGKPRLIKAK